MINRPASYGLGTLGLGFSADTLSGDERLKAVADTVAVTSRWTEALPDFIDASLLTEIDGKLLYDGIMVSDAVAIIVGILSGLLLVGRFVGDVIFFLYRSRLERLEKEFMEKNK